VLWAAHIVLAAERADQLSHKQPVARVVAEGLAAEHFDPRVVEPFAQVELETGQSRRQLKLSASELKMGMFLVEDAKSLAGVVMARGGQEVTPTVAVLLRRMADRNNLLEPLTVSVKA
jgi:hypothetical protein